MSHNNGRKETTLGIPDHSDATGIVTSREQENGNGQPGTKPRESVSPLAEANIFPRLTTLIISSRDFHTAFAELIQSYVDGQANSEQEHRLMDHLVMTVLQICLAHPESPFNLRVSEISRTSSKESGFREALLGYYSDEEKVMPGHREEHELGHKIGQDFRALFPKVILEAAIYLTRRENDKKGDTWNYLGKLRDYIEHRAFIITPDQLKVFEELARENLVNSGFEHSFPVAAPAPLRDKRLRENYKNSLEQPSVSYPSISKAQAVGEAVRLVLTDPNSPYYIRLLQIRFANNQKIIISILERLQNSASANEHQHLLGEVVPDEEAAAAPYAEELRIFCREVADILFNRNYPEQKKGENYHLRVGVGAKVFEEHFQTAIEDLGFLETLKKYFPSNSRVFSR